MNSVSLTLVNLKPVHLEAASLNQPNLNQPRLSGLDAGKAVSQNVTISQNVTVPLQRPIQALLFLCGYNAVRSPMAECLARASFGQKLYVQSAGIRPGVTDDFMVAALQEIGLDASKHKPRTLDDLVDYEGLNFDLIVTLSPEAHHAALEITRHLSTLVEYWPTVDPTLIQGAREQRLQAYRVVRDGLLERIKLRLGSAL